MPRLSKTLWQGVMAFFILGWAASSAAAVFQNGSFETGDYTGWTLWEDEPQPPAYPINTWGIVQNNEAINSGTSILDYFNNLMEYQNSSWPGQSVLDGKNFMAIQLQDCGGKARLSQDITVPENATALSWDMAYDNHLAKEFSNSQYVAVYIRDLDDNILETLFITGPDSQQEVDTMTTFSRDISKYAGQTVRVDVELQVQVNYLPVGLDNFRVEVTPVVTGPKPVLPPGWGMQEPRGWEGPMPPGLQKQEKVPAGFGLDKGKKKGWFK